MRPEQVEFSGGVESGLAIIRAFLWFCQPGYTDSRRREKGENLEFSSNLLVDSKIVQK